MDNYYDKVAFKKPSDSMVELVENNNRIDPSLYAKYDVKRGLRNANGTGVKVGITRISEVQGYDIKDGKKIPKEGHLYYRGIDLSTLVHSYQKEGRLGYEEVAYLLIFGELPNEKRLNQWKEILDLHRNLPNRFVEDVILDTPSKNIMNKMQRTVLTLYSYDPNPDDTSMENVLIQCINLIAKLPLLMSYSYQSMKHYFYDDSLVLHNPIKGGSAAENILHLTRNDSNFTRLEAEVLDLLLMVQADHGAGNNSTFATHVVSSTGTDTYSAISTALGSLKGPKHGGANAQVDAMMSNIKVNVKDWDDLDELENYLNQILDKKVYNKKGLIYGLGHAVYTKSDPRCELLRSKAGELAESKGQGEEFKLLNNVEKIGVKLMKERRGGDFEICGNVDLYTGFVMNMLKIPNELHTPVFASSRIAGWCAHRIEQVMDDKIIRPAYISLTDQRPYIPLKDRK